MQKFEKKNFIKKLHKKTLKKRKKCRKNKKNIEKIQNVILSKKMQKEITVLLNFYGQFNFFANFY